MSSALRVPDPPSRKLSKNEQLKTVTEEAEHILKEHRAGRMSSTEAGERLSELKRRYASLFDRFLAL
jgi:hypothetical protein